MTRPPRGQQRTALVSIVAATVLVALKLGTGLVSGSLGLISAGIESSGDVVAAVLTLIAIRAGARPADPGHHYGHRRAENLAALGEAAILTGGGLVVVVEAVRRLLGAEVELEARGYVFAVIATALAIDVSRVIVSLRTARRYASPALRSNAFHFAGDTAGSLAVLVGLLLVEAGFHHGDAIAALFVAGIIFAAATRLIIDNAGVLMDRAPSEADEAARAAIDALGPDIQLERLRLRESAGRYFADAVVAVSPGRAVVEGHAAADEVEAAVQEVLPESDVVVHVEPRRRGLDLRERVLSAALAEPLVQEAHDISIFEHGERASVSLHLKLPRGMPLAEAHQIAERVEQAIRADHRVDDVQTHLEPLEEPLSSRPVDPVGEREQIRAIDAVVRERTGQPPRSVRVVPTEAGVVVFLTVALPADRSLPAAHQLATELEVALRRRHEGIADVVVHTEP